VPNGGIMKIGIDLHGVIDSNPKLFKMVLFGLSMSGKVKIYIVSGPPKADIISELENLGIEQDLHYDEVYSVVDFLKESGVKMWQDERSRWWTNEEDWCASKSKICDKLHLDIMLDDKEMYRAGFNNIPTKFVLYEE
jgi:predicted peroxiredoxin